MAPRREADLYPAIKAFLEGQGYAVKGEVNGCDVVAVRGTEAPVIVELKRRFSLDLVFQAITRQTLTDAVYVAVADTGASGSTMRRRGKDVTRLCRMLGLGLLIIHGDGAAGQVEARLDPKPYRPQQSRRRRDRLLREFAHRVGDPNKGGSTGTPIVTAYRQDALRCADLLARQGPLKLANVRTLTGVGRAGRILQRDVYGWFEPVRRGTYAITPKGRAALEDFADVVAALAGGAGAPKETARRRRSA